MSSFGIHFEKHHFQSHQNLLRRLTSTFRGWRWEFMRMTIVQKYLFNIWKNTLNLIKIGITRVQSSRNCASRMLSGITISHLSIFTQTGAYIADSSPRHGMPQKWNLTSKYIRTA